MQLFVELRQDTDLEWVFIDGSIIKAHQHGVLGIFPSKKT